MNFPSTSLATALGTAALAMAAPLASAATVNATAAIGPYASQSIDIQNCGRGCAQTLDLGSIALQVNTAVTDPAYAAQLPLGATVFAWSLEAPDKSNGWASLGTASTAYGVGKYRPPGWDAGVLMLLEQFGSQVTDSVSAAAMQLAIWKIGVDDSIRSLTNGSFRAVRETNTGVYDQAQTWLNDVNWSYDDIGGYVYDGPAYVRLSNDTHWDLITAGEPIGAVSAVPLPGAAWMFLSALGVGGALRRKSRKALAA